MLPLAAELEGLQSRPLQVLVQDAGAVLDDHVARPGDWVGRHRDAQGHGRLTTPLTWGCQASVAMAMRVGVKPRDQAAACTCLSE